MAAAGVAAPAKAAQPTAIETRASDRMLSPPAHCIVCLGEREVHCACQCAADLVRDLWPLRAAPIGSSEAICHARRVRCAGAPQFV
jgi:hypothetical protein